MYGKATTRCTGCGLVQFRPKSGACRRCRKPIPRAKFPINFRAVETIGPAIGLYRTLAGKSQSQIGLNRTYLANIELGVRIPTLYTLERISERIGVPVASFFMVPSDIFQDSFVMEVYRLSKGEPKRQKDILDVLRQFSSKGKSDEKGAKAIDSANSADGSAAPIDGDRPTAHGLLSEARCES